MRHRAFALLLMSLAFAPRSAEAVKAETAGLLLTTAVLGIEAGVAGLQGRSSWAAQLYQAAEPEGWLLRVESEAPRGDFARSFRDIRVDTLDLARAWALPLGFEVQLGGGLFNATGSSGEPLSAAPFQDSDAWGLHIGPGLRYKLPAWRGLHVYADTSIHLLLTIPEFPADGTRWNGLIRHGFGLAYDVGGLGRVEAGWHWGHVSNGSGTGEGNPSWDGRGGWVGWRFDL